MPKPSLWPIVALVTVALTCVTVALALHVDVTAIVGIINLAALPVIATYLNGKLDKIDVNTNGNIARKDEQIANLVDHIKTHNSVPLDQPIIPVTATLQVVPKEDVT